MNFSNETITGSNHASKNNPSTDPLKNTFNTSNHSKKPKQYRQRYHHLQKALSANEAHGQDVSNQSPSTQKRVTPKDAKHSHPKKESQQFRNRTRHCPHNPCPNFPTTCALQHRSNLNDVKRTVASIKKDRYFLNYVFSLLSEEERIFQITRLKYAYQFKDPVRLGTDWTPKKITYKTYENMTHKEIFALRMKEWYNMQVEIDSKHLLTKGKSAKQIFSLLRSYLEAVMKHERQRRNKRDIADQLKCINKLYALANFSHHDKGDPAQLPSINNKDEVREKMILISFDEVMKYMDLVEIILLEWGYLQQ